MLKILTPSVWKTNNNHIYSNAVYSGSLHLADINNRILYYVMLLECISSRLYKSTLLETCMVLQPRDESIAGLRCCLESSTCFGTIHLIVAGILQTANLTSDLIYIHLVMNGKAHADIFLTFYWVICTGLYLACSVETSTHTDNLPAASSGNVDCSGKYWIPYNVASVLFKRCIWQKWKYKKKN